MMGGRILLCWTLTLLVACGSEDPNTALRGLIEAAEVAAEDRDAGFFADVLSERYTDARGHDRDQLVALLRGYFFSHDSIEVVTRIDSITLNGTDAADVVVFAGIVGRRGGASLIEGLDGRLYRVELELIVEDGDWRIIGAGWARALE